MAKKPPTREQIRIVGCPKCGASPGHRCAETNPRSYGGMPGRYVREANHSERVALYTIASFTNDAGVKS